MIKVSKVTLDLQVVKATKALQDLQAVTLDHKASRANRVVKVILDLLVVKV